MELYNTQLKASYILELVNKFISDLEDKKTAKQIWDLYEYCSYFELVTNFKLTKKVSNQSRVLIGLVAENIVQRGFPALAPSIIEELNLCDGKVVTVKNILNSLVIYDKDIDQNQFLSFYGKTTAGTIERVDPSDRELDFLHLVDPFIFQHLELQKPVEHLIEFPNTDASKYSYHTNYCLNMAKEEVLDYFKEQLLDFSLIIPGGRCLNIEIDGAQHLDADQAIKDKERDVLCKELGWSSLRIPTNQITAMGYMNSIHKFIEEYRNFIIPNVPAENYIRIPLYAARYALTFLKLINSGIFNLYDKEPVDIEIETVYSDAALYGIKNALDILYHLDSMLGNEKSRIKSIRIKITDFGGLNPHFYKLRAGVGITNIVGPVQNFNKNCLVIKENMDARLNTFSNNVDRYSSRRKIVWIFSAFGQSHRYEINHSSNRVHYVMDTNADEHLRYFLKDIFRKNDFRDKQIEIVKGLLEEHNVIGVMPTGTGKTLTFQLPALLQTGTSIVISPLISLMNDQVHNLKIACLENVATINSSAGVLAKRNALKNFENYAYNFLYISPERLQISAFKTLLKYMDISFVIVDEAHCVSQWGHDFRTAYLRAGETIFSSVDNIKIAAVTGTASCNVITDMKRELNITKDLRVIQSDDFRRPELNFKVLYTKDNFDIKEKIREDSLSDVLNTAIEYLKNNSEGIVNDFFEKENLNYVHAGIIFAPYATAAEAGTNVIRGQLQKKFQKVTFGEYHGQMDSDFKNSQQKDFTEGKISLLVATKAFGMGIDKSNIRLTVHACLPESIEGFYQEAGRAGRDKQYALNILVAPPKGTSYEGSADSRIHEFFMSNNYPPLEELLKQANDYMGRKYITEKNFRDALLRSTGDLEDILDGFKIDVSNKGAYIIFPENIQNKSKSLGKCSVEIDSNGRMEFGKLINARGVENNVTASIFAEHVKKTIKENYESNPSYNGIRGSNEFHLELNKYSYEKNYSIFDALKKVQDTDAGIDCYVGLNGKALENPIAILLRKIIQEKSDKFVLRADEKAALDRFTKAITGYCRKCFFDFYSKFRDFAEAKGISSVDDVVFNKAISDIKDGLNRDNNINQALGYVISEMQMARLNLNTVADIYIKINSIRRNNGMVAYSISEFCEQIREIEQEVNSVVLSIEDKIIYYLGLLRVYDRFERSYSPDYMRIHIVKVTKASLLESLKDYIKKFETADYVSRRIKNSIFDGIDDNDVVKLVKVAFETIIRYSYDKIKAFRCQQAKNLYACISEDDAQKPEVFENAVYSYFEAKYAEDLLKFVKTETPAGVAEWLMDFKEKSNNENEFILENLSHLRTSARKVLVDYQQSYSLRLFEAYGIIQDKDMLVEDGINLYIEAIEKLKSLNRTRYIQPLIKYCELCLDISDKEQLENIQKSIDLNKDYQNAEELREFRSVLAEKLRR